MPTVHAPLTHAAAALATLQRLPQAPQAATLDCNSTQAPSQQLCAAGQGRSVVQPMTQTLPTQSDPAAQWSLVTHCTHCRDCGSQRVIAPPSAAQASSLPQPGSATSAGPVSQGPCGGPVSAEPVSAGPVSVLASRGPVSAGPRSVPASSGGATVPF